MADFETIVSIVGFMIISHLVLINGGGAEYLFDIPEDTEPPQLIPQETNVGFETVDLEADAFSSVNISFADYSDISNPSYPLGYRGLTNNSTVLVLQPGTETGTVLYNTPGVQSVRVLASKKCGGFFSSSRMEIVSEQPSDTPDNICGEVEANVEQGLDANFVRFNFLSTSEGGGTPELYFFEWSQSRQNFEPGGESLFATLAGGLDDLGQLVLYPFRLWEYFSVFPFYIRVFYGAILAYLSIVIIRGL